MMIGPASLESLYRATYSKNKYTSKLSQSAFTTDTTSAASDRICISAEGTLLQAAAKATAAAGSVPTASPQRLNSLREQINSGSYCIPSADIASKMLGRGLPTLEVSK